MKKYTLLLIIIGIISCQNQYDSNESVREAISSKARTNYSSTNKKALKEENQRAKKKIIRSASTKMEVLDVRSASEEINAMILDHEGYISDQNITDIEGRQKANFTLRVPSDSLQSLLNQLSDLAVRVDYMKTISNDVSEEYVDLTSRLNTKEEVHQRYIDILRNKAGTIEELLSAERRIGILQEEIEVAQGKIRFYDEEVLLSTVNVQIYKNEILVAEVKSRFIPFWSNAEDQFIGGWNMLIRIAIVVIGFWPIWFFGGVGYLAVRKIKQTRS